MAGEKCEASSAREAVDALRRLAGHAGLRPRDVDNFSWSADALDELARVAEALGDAVEEVAGEQSQPVRAHADQLATAIVAHRNSLLRHGAPGDDVPQPQPQPQPQPPRDRRAPAEQHATPANDAAHRVVSRGRLLR